MKLLRLSTFDNGGVGSHEDTGASAAWKKDIIVACLLTSSAGAEVFLIFAIDFWRVNYLAQRRRRDGRRCYGSHSGYKAKKRL